MQIRPSSELRNNYKEISEIAKTTREPIVLTVNGRGDTVLVDYDVYEELRAQIQILQDINAAEADIREGRIVDINELKKSLAEIK